jgi:enediyne biosynthesis protein E4
VRVGAQVDQMTTAVGYASASNFGVHFGLGDVAKVPRIEITWPSGVTQVLEDVPVNQIVTVTEAKSGP